MKILELIKIFINIELLIYIKKHIHPKIWKEYKGEIAEQIAGKLYYEKKV